MALEIISLVKTCCDALIFFDVFVYCADAATIPEQRGKIFTKGQASIIYSPQAEDQNFVVAAILENEILPTQGQQNAEKTNETALWSKRLLSIKNELLIKNLSIILYLIRICCCHIPSTSSMHIPSSQNPDH